MQADRVEHAVWEKRARMLVRFELGAWVEPQVQEPRAWQEQVLRARGLEPERGLEPKQMQELSVQLQGLAQE